jgi:L-alanine-DL-glutamate epimerase-like enolase superfamily enzyme
MSTWEQVAGLHVEIESHALEGLQLDFSAEFQRLTTVVRLRGDGHEGLGEDVTYDGLDHIALQSDGASLPLAGSHTLESFSRMLEEEVDLWPSPAVRDVSERYRRWAFESAALDLGLRQAGVSLAELLGREARPLNYVVSMRLGAWDADEPDRADKVHAVLARYPGTRFKLDPTNTWTQELVDELVETGAVDSLDLKGFYRGTPVDVITDPELYRMCIESFPEAWLEDPDVTDQTRPLLELVRERVTWDAPIHSIADVEAMPWTPRMVNVKPSRVGSVRELFDLYDYCEREGIGAYGGGQTELGVGRGQIQYLASLFHPDTPNDTAPSGFNQPQLPDGMPSSPLDPRIEPTGFRWAG